uniref:C2H2-type domain-containing protein n=1 Tax=Oryza nivara TaxID=4536 RepID=A0A0E0GVN4_ORYNI
MTKHPRDGEVISLSLSLTLGAAADSGERKKPRRGSSPAASGSGDFVCKTCSRAFPSFQALGGHRTSHLRGRHGLALGLAAATAKETTKKVQEKPAAAATHECHICGQGFEMGQALGGHMRRHREEAAAAAAAGRPLATEHRLRQGGCQGKIAIEVIESRSSGGHRAGPNLEVFELGHVRSGIGATTLAVTEESDTRGLGINGASSCQALEGGVRGRPLVAGRGADGEGEKRAGAGEAEDKGIRRT